MDSVEAPLLIRFDQHTGDDKGPFCPFSPHPVAQAPDPEMGSIYQAIIEGFGYIH